MLSVLTLCCYLSCFKTNMGIWITRAVAALLRTCVLLCAFSKFYSNSYTKTQCSWHLLNAVVILTGKKKTCTRIKDVPQLLAAFSLLWEGALSLFCKLSWLLCLYFCKTRAELQLALHCTLKWRDSGCWSPSVVHWMFWPWFGCRRWGMGQEVFPYNLPPYFSPDVCLLAGSLTSWRWDY